MLQHDCVNWAPTNAMQLTYASVQRPTGEHKDHMVNRVPFTALLATTVWPFTYWVWLKRWGSSPNFRTSIFHDTKRNLILESDSVLYFERAACLIYSDTWRSLLVALLGCGIVLAFRIQWVDQLKILSHENTSQMFASDQRNKTRITLSYGL
jgi:hypothetical protein